MSTNADDTPSENGSSLMRELAHELRDALSPLASAADLARLRNFDPEASRLLAQKVERGLRRALALLDAFVLAEQCEHGTLPLRLRTVRLEEILESTRREFGAAERYAFESPGRSSTVRADPVRSAEALAAILQRTAAITPPEQLVGVRQAGTAAQPEIRVNTRVNPADIPAEDWITSHRGGDGRMALRTAQRIMALQGGALELLKESDGRFELIMRFAAGAVPLVAEPQPSAAPPPQVAEPSRAGGATRAAAERVLIVEDSAEVRRAYREALVALGYSVLEAADAEQALSALEHTRPDVALIDIHLPRMNGYRLAQAIRARAGAAIYLVMLSGMALDAVTRGLAREAGFDECLDKMAGPVALRELLEAGAGHRG